MADAEDHRPRGGLFVRLFSAARKSHAFPGATPNHLYPVPNVRAVFMPKSDIESIVGNYPL
jgi:hypothetical protein